MGRFCIWTESAPRKSGERYGTWRQAASLKSNYSLPMHKMLNTSLSRPLKSPEIQRALQATRKKIHRRVLKNPLENLRLLLTFNLQQGLCAGAPLLGRPRATKSAWVRRRQHQEPHQIRRGLRARSLWWEKRLQGTKEPAAEKKPAPEEKKAAAHTYICLFHKRQLFWGS